MRASLSLFFFLWLNTPVFAAESAVSANRTEASRHYSVTLLSSFDPIPDSMIPRDVAGNVYRTQANIFGRSIYFVRVGFYASAGEAGVAKDRLLKRFPGALVNEVTDDEYFKFTGGQKSIVATTPAKPAIAAPSAPVTPPKPVATLPVPPQPLAIIPAPAAPSPAAPATTATTAPAEATTAAAVPVAKTPAAETPSDSAKPVDPQQLASDIEQQAASLMEQARAALLQGDNVKAVSLLGRLLRLLPNKQSQEAQELIGVAHERLKETAKAKQAYELYLKLYPEGADADRVRQRLATLETIVASPKLKTPQQKDNVGGINGNFSQYYYHGKSQVDTSTTINLGPTLTQPTLTSDNQSAIVNNLDFRAQYRSGNWENRMVIRDSYTANFLAGTDNLNRLYSLYYEAANKADEYSGRFGRQPGTAGMLGRFDGALVGYNFLPKWRLNFAAGYPVEFNGIDSTKQFWGTSLDFGLFLDHWNGSLYYTQQTVDGIADRQAVGAELRYFDTRGSALLFLDYDTLFGLWNVVSFQGTWQSSAATTWNTTLEKRLAPTISTSNFLFNPNSLVCGAVCNSTSVKEWLTQTTNTEADLRQTAVDNTPTYSLYSVGGAHNFNSTWQLGGDIKRYNLSAAPSATAVTTTLTAGSTMMYTVQMIANGLFRDRDLTVLSVSYLDSSASTGEILALTNRMLFLDRWTLDIALTFNIDNAAPITDPLSGTVTQIDTQRLAPSLRLAYQWRKNIAFETEMTLEKNTTHTTTTTTAPSTTISDTTANNSNFMLGYRWSF